MCRHLTYADSCLGHFHYTPSPLNRSMGWRLYNVLSGCSHVPISSPASTVGGWAGGCSSGPLLSPGNICAHQRLGTSLQAVAPRPVFFCAANATRLSDGIESLSSRSPVCKIRSCRLYMMYANMYRM